VKWPATDLVLLQNALYFRGVSKPYDEPLCIANLLDLKADYILEVGTKETQNKSDETKVAMQRMARVWKLIAEKTEDQQLPANIIFLADELPPSKKAENMLDIDGWRWAPRTLIASDAVDSLRDFSATTTRFNTDGTKTPFGKVVLDDSVEPRSTVPPCRGFKVKFPGFILNVRPRRADFPRRYLHPWERTAENHEDKLVFRDISTGKYHFIIDFYRSRKLSVWSKAETTEYDNRQGRALCDIVDQGRAALICNPNLSEGNYFTYCLLVQLEDNQVIVGSKELKVKRCRTVLLVEPDAAASLVAQRMDALATEAANESFTRDLVSTEDVHSTDYDKAVATAKVGLRTMAEDLWDGDDEFRTAAVDSLGKSPGLRSALWASIPTHYSHHIEARELGEDQYWIVD
jgi:hypothetical protein